MRICIPGPVGGTKDYLTDAAAEWWNEYLNRSYYHWHLRCKKNISYGDTQVTRFYVDIRDNAISNSILYSFRTLWQDKACLIVEGEKTRMGVGNGFMGNAKYVARILCPSKNAFDRIEEITKAVIDVANDYDCIFVSLGPAAKVLVWRLYKKGITAIDVGHLDVEYEWMRSGGHERKNIPGKYVNEVKGGFNVTDEIVDKSYLESILTTIV